MELKKISVLCLCSTLTLAALPWPTQAFSWASIATFLFSLQNELSAWNITTKQTALSANQIAATEREAKKQLATAIGTIGMVEQSAKALTSFDSVLGQPNTIKCEAQQQGKLFVESVAQQQRDSAKLMSNFAASRVGSRAAADMEKLTQHKETYCSISEAKQGICSLTPNGMQAWDVDYSGAYTESTLSPEGELAGYAYAAMVTDLRAEANSDCTTTACTAAQAQQLAASAFTAMSASSLVGQVTARRMPVLD